MPLRDDAVDAARSGCTRSACRRTQTLRVAPDAATTKARQRGLPPPRRRADPRRLRRRLQGGLAADAGRRSSRPPSRASTTSWSAATPSRPPTRRSRCWPSWCRWRSPRSTPTGRRRQVRHDHDHRARSSTPARSSSWCGPGIAEYEPVVYQVIDATKIIATFDLTAPRTACTTSR